MFYIGTFTFILPARQISGQCISLQYLAGNLVILKILGRTHRQAKEKREQEKERENNTVKYV